jgi:hypothetical protein
MATPVKTESHPTPQTSGRKVKTHIQAGSDPIGSTGTNPNETLVRLPHPTAGLKVKTHVKAGLAQKQWHPTD